jgi:hypothetical protein
MHSGIAGARRHNMIDLNGIRTNRIVKLCLSRSRRSPIALVLKRALEGNL